MFQIGVVPSVMDRRILYLLLRLPLNPSLPTGNLLQLAHGVSPYIGNCLLHRGHVWPMDTSTDSRVYGMFVLSFLFPSFISFHFFIVFCLSVFLLFQFRCRAGWPDCMTGHERYSGHLSVLHLILYLPCRGMSRRIHDYSFFILDFGSDPVR